MSNREPEQRLLVPGPGRRVRDPISLRVLPDAGDYKPLTTYWLRRLQDGDVLDATPATQPSAAQEE